ncbi:PREDICTED: putative nuclease HARBI1 [Camelina sativa]|uniref:Nuclease HARBI1 n=1 Tax=Camelina sativa TaxID=90675 RepID=A0ABM0UTT6_CAMSA|nr:PREDICTED: putative nuclease HARBI1 [Camelina sativa]
MEDLLIQPTLDYYERYIHRGPYQTGGGLGWQNLRDRIQNDNAACLQLLRMSFAAFTELCNILSQNYGLQPTQNVSVEESVAMFLRVCGHNEVQRDIGLRFGRNQETVKRKFGEVLRATELLAFDYIKTPTMQELRRIPQHLQADRRYWPFFSGFVGAMDGTHVCVKVKHELQAMYWSRHDRTSFNVMAICDMNILFTYVWNGAPGSCHDTRVLSLAQDGDPEFPLPPGDKYYVVDSGYPNKQGFLAPYRSSRNRVVRYHLSQFNNGPPPMNKEELYNRSHASLRSIIERTFGVWKKKWRILRDDPRYGLEVQKRVIIATMGLHNFIRVSNFSDTDFFEDFSEVHTENEQNDSNEQDEAEREDRPYMANIRDNIADMLWDNRNNRF